MTQKTFVKGSEFPSLQKDKLRLYSMRFCPFAQRTRLVLAHKQIPHETINVHLRQKPDWFLEKSPVALVPILEYNDEIVYESHICDEYLNEKYPEKPLLPTDPYKKAHQRIIMDQYAKFVTHYYQYVRCEDPSEKQAIMSEMVKRHKFLDKELGDKKYFGGTEPCMLDYHIWPWYERINILGTFKELKEKLIQTYPRMGDWIGAMYDTQAVKQMGLDYDTYMMYEDSKVDGQVNYDVGL